MTKIQLGDSKLSIPTSWDELTLGNYEKWYARKPEDHTEYVQYMADLCHTDPEPLRQAPTEVLGAIAQSLSFMQDADFEPKPRVRIGSEDYFVSSSDRLTLGEWVDIDSVMADQQSTSKLSDLMAIVCRPADEEYNHQRAVERAHLFREQPCSKMMPVVGFFLHREKNLNEILSHSSEVVAAASQLLQDTKTFVASGDGIKRLPIWQRIRYYFLIRSLEKRLSRCSAFFSIG